MGGNLKAKRKKKLDKKFVVRRVVVFGGSILFIAMIVVFSIVALNGFKEQNTLRAKYKINFSDEEIEEIKKDLQIQNVNLQWQGDLSQTNKPKKIVVHHTARNGLSVDEIHKSHIANGWAGIGYHFYIRQDGTIFSGRPENVEGAHVKNG